MGLKTRGILVAWGMLWVVLYFDFDRLSFMNISLLCVSLPKMILIICMSNYA